MWGIKIKQTTSTESKMLNDSVRSSRADTKHVARIRFILIVVAVLFALYGIWYLYNLRAQQQRVIVVPTQQKFFSSKLETLLANPPKQDATLAERAKYYQDLSFVYADMGRYREAIGAFEKREAFPADGLKYYHYINLARYHHELGENEAANRALNTAASMLQSGSEDNDIYSRAEELQNIEKLRKEYAQ